MGKTLSIIAGATISLMAVSLYFTVSALNSARTERDTAIERSNNQGEQVRLCRAELGTNVEIIKKTMESHNKMVDAAVEVAKANKTQSEEFLRQAGRWSTPVKILTPDGTCEARLNRITRYVDEFHAEKYGAR